MATGSELFAGAGEVARRYRSIDWAATSLGPVEDWPIALQIAVRTALEAPVPIAVWSGRDLLGLYNDAYARMLRGRHPAALAQPYREVWRDIWEFAGPLFERIRKGGASIFQQDAPFTLGSGNQLEISPNAAPNAWFTFSLSPIRDEHGEIIAFLNIAAETTRRVLAERERESARADAEAVDARFRDMFAQAPAFMAVLRGPTHVFEYANDAYYRLVGHRELIGLGVFDALPEARGQGFEHALNRVFASGTPFVGRESPIQIARTPDQPPEQRYVDFIYYPISEPDGTRSGVVVHGYDVTDHVLLRHEAQRARAEAEQANRAKSQFLANMSHEIRTPINAIVGYADLLDAGLGGPLSGTQQNYIDRIRASSRHLLTLVNDLLDMAKVEAGEMRVGRRVSSVDTVVQAALHMMSQQARAKNITLQCEPPDERLRFLGDEDRARQIVLNLLSNAVKFTNPGGEVVVRYFARDNCEPATGGPCVIIEVSDTGRGIAESERERIFEPFAQSSHERIPRMTGTGLGLSISRKLARLMGGDITVESTVGVGSTFTVRLASAARGEEGVTERWLRADLPREAANIAGLGSFGRRLIENAEPLEHELVEQLSGTTPHLPDAEQSELADHAAAYFATLGKLLVNLDTLRGTAAAQDSEDILKVVTERHGKQRRRLGWSRPDLEHEYTVLHSLLDSFLRNQAAPSVGEDVDPVLGVVHNLLNYGEQGSLAGFDADGATRA